MHAVVVLLICLMRPTWEGGAPRNGSARAVEAGSIGPFPVLASSIFMLVLVKGKILL